MLITSRESRRWIVPKGWPMKNKAPSEAAKIEALQEAGVRGTICTTAIELELKRLIATFDPV